MNKCDLDLPGTKYRDTSSIPAFTILCYKDSYTGNYGRIEDRYQPRFGGGVGLGWQRGCLSCSPVMNGK